jgi:hypothetical protein
VINALRRYAHDLAYGFLGLWWFVRSGFLDLWYGGLLDLWYGLGRRLRLGRPPASGGKIAGMGDYPGAELHGEMERLIEELRELETAGTASEGTGR